MLFSGCGAKQSDVKETTTSVEAETTYMTTEGFYKLNEVTENYSFKKTENEDKGYVKYSGEYGLTSGNKNTIEVGYTKNDREGYVEIDGNRVSMSVDNIEDVKIVDIDISDSYKEIAVYDAGPSGDPNVIFYRFTENKVREIGYGEANTYYDEILFDKHGRVIDEYGYIDFIDIPIVVKYKDMKSNSEQEVVVDYSSALNKTYTISRNITVAFTKSDDENMKNINGDTEYIELKAGDKIVLIGMKLEWKTFYIELPDGRRGIVETQLAG